MFEVVKESDLVLLVSDAAQAELSGASSSA
jgi:hypothetical protein